MNSRHAICQPAPGNGRPQAFGARRMAVQGDDGTGRPFSELERLSADAAAQIKDFRRSAKPTAKIKCSRGTTAVAWSLAGQVFVNLEENRL